MGDAGTSTTSLSRLAVVVVLTTSAVVLGAIALHLTASSSSRRSQEPGSLPARVALARRAAVIEPWNAEFARRERVLRRWEEGQVLLQAGDYNRAVDILREAYVEDVGNSDLLAIFKRAQATQALETNRKAHLQHGHEGPGGTLEPGDIER